MIEIDLCIIIPAFNVAKCISECICSLETQKEVPSEFRYEIIVVDDGSIDNTSGVVKNLRQKYENITLIEEKNGGVSVARNNGIMHARGKYITFVDADDTVSNKYIATIAQDLDDTDWIIFGYSCIEQNKSKNFIPQDNYSLSELYNNFLFNSPWNKVYKRNNIKSFFNPDIKVGEDLLFNIEYSKNIKTHKIITEVLYNYVIRYGSAMTSYKKEYIDNYIYVFNIASSSGFFDKKVLVSRFIGSLFNSLCNMVDDKKIESLNEIEYATERLHSINIYISKNSYASLVINALQHRRKLVAYLLTSLYTKVRKCKRAIKSGISK